MSYTKNTWVTGDTITADKMNNIEKGIGNNDQNVSKVLVEFEEYKTTILNMMHPVGSIYMTTDPTNPSEILGGTWQAWGSGCVPVGVDTSQTEFSSVEKTGGEKTHKLTVSEMPSHSHDGITFSELAGTHLMAYDNGVKPANGTGAHWSIQNTLEVGERTAVTIKAGGDMAHNNLQPYITCYMWKRTA